MIALLALLNLCTAAVAVESIYSGANKAQTGEDIFLYETYFYRKTRGVILESGALDGIRFSTTYLFERLFNWTSIHIEGDLKNFKKLQENRPESTNINIALCDKKRTLHYVQHKGGAVSGIKEFMDASFLAWRYTNKQAFNITEIQCLPMKDAMAELKVAHVDIWILDVEGGELSVLQGVDFSSFQADVIMMETTGSKSNLALQFLQDLNYQCCLVPGAIRHIENHVCLRHDFKPSTAPYITLAPLAASDARQKCVLPPKTGRTTVSNSKSKILS